MEVLPAASPPSGLPQRRPDTALHPRAVPGARAFRSHPAENLSLQETELHSCPEGRPPSVLCPPLGSWREPGMTTDLSASQDLDPRRPRDPRRQCVLGGFLGPGPGSTQKLPPHLPEAYTLSLAKPRAGRRGQGERLSESAVWEPPLPAAGSALSSAPSSFLRSLLPARCWCWCWPGRPRHPGGRQTADIARRLPRPLLGGRSLGE